MTDPSGRFKARMVPVSTTGGKSSPGSDSGLRPRSAKSRLCQRTTTGSGQGCSKRYAAPVRDCRGPQYKEGSYGAGGRN